MPPRHPSPPQDHPRWPVLVAEQSGVLSLRQLYELGASPDLVVAHLDALRWQRPLPRTYAVFTGPLSRRARLAAALCYGGGAAVLSHRTAAEEWGMVRVEDDGPVHLTVPYTSSAVSQPGVTVHRSRAYRHIVVLTDPPRTSRADTAIDLAVEEPDARAARQVLTGLLTGGRVRPLDVERRLLERPPRRYRRPLADAVRMVRLGVQSVLEEAYAVDVERAHGLPEATRQAPVTVDGMTLWEDAVYDHIGIPLTVRLDGRTHLVDDVAFRDRRRDNAAELAGRSRLVFGWTEVSRDPCGAADEVARVLTRHGWSGSPRSCPACS